MTTKIASILLTALIMTAGFSSCNNSSKSSEQTQEEILPEGMQRYQADGFSVVWLRDNAEAKINPVSLFPTAPEGLADSLGLSDGIPASMSAFLIQQDGKNLLFDTGMGGMILEHLDSIGVKPENIDVIYLTHLHADHIGGLAKDGIKVFPNAQLYLGRQEYEAWMAMDEQKNQMQKEMLEPYKDVLHLFEFDEVLPYDVKALNSVGHTPGHTSYLKGDVLIGGDIMHGVALQIDHPEVNASYDMDQEKAAESRARMIDLAKSQKLLLCGMHFPDGGAVDFR